MQAVLHWLLLAWACLLGAAAWAADPVAVPALSARVTDLTATLSAAERTQLEQQLAAFEQRRGSQIAILIVPTTQPEPIEAYSIRVAEQWKIGRRGSDDGVILVVAKDDRTLRIEVGYGLEGAIPDAIAKRVIAEVIVPKFRQGDFPGGLRDGVAQIQSLIEGEQLPPPRARGGHSDFGGGFPELLVTGMVVAMTLGGILNLILGRLLGSGIAGGVVGGIAWLLTASLLTGIVAALAAFIFALLFAGRGAVGRHGGWGGGGGGGWSGGGGGGWSGGGGGFGGGGASGRW